MPYSEEGSPSRYILSTVIIVLVLAPLSLASRTLGIPVFYRGVEVGCAEPFDNIINELARDFGNYSVYFFGIKGCPECVEMEEYLRNFVRPEDMVYIDVTMYRDVFSRLLAKLKEFVAEKYVSEVPIIVVVRDSAIAAVSVGLYHNDSFWLYAISGVYRGSCQVVPVVSPTKGYADVLVGALVLGLVSALSPCVLYFYMGLILSYSIHEHSYRLRKLMLFVVGLGLGYLMLLLGLTSITAVFRPFSWVVLLAFGIYMILHSRGLLGCLVGGRSCREIGYYELGRSTAIFGGALPLLLGLLAAISAVPCSAGYFVLLQTAYGLAGSPGTGLVIAVYVGAFVMPYMVISTASSKLLRRLDKFLGKIPIAELVGGVILISLGLYLAITGFIM